MTIEVIESEGGGMNRLYQILVEGRDELDLSSYILTAAALRDDWFIKRQVEAVKKGRRRWRER